MTETNVHIFIGEFENRDDATSYTQGIWEPEPDEPATDSNAARIRKTAWAFSNAASGS